MQKNVFLPPFKSFLTSHGIIHQSSCPHTPQQNGVAECKHRHIVDIALTLLVNAKAPLKFWGDAVLTACYLINCMPSSVLGDKIPQSLLFPQDPLYVVPPRVFGSTCFVHDLTPGHDKCVFLDAPQVSEQECSSQVDHRYGITYERHRHKAPNVSLPPNPQDSAPTPISSPATVPPDTSADQPITIRKGNRSTRNPYPVYNFVSYHMLSSCHSAFVSISSRVETGND
jgi:hypothetical protein